jgi:transposase
MKEYQYFIGIDIGKEKADVVFHDKKGGKDGIIALTDVGIGLFLQQNEEALRQALVVLEATGGYENGLLLALAKAGVSVHRVSPLQSKNYRCSVQLRGKTDRQDALILAKYGAERHRTLAIFTAPEEKTIHLQQLISRRDDLVRQRAADVTRLQHPNYAKVTAHVQPLIDICSQHINEIELEINALIAACETLTKKKKCLLGVAGIGEKTAMLLLGCFSELGTLNKKQVASLAGLAPHPRDSGKMVGYRSTGGGRSSVRRGLFMAAMGAINTKNSTLQAFYSCYKS